MVSNSPLPERAVRLLTSCALAAALALSLFAPMTVRAAGDQTQQDMMLYVTDETAECVVFLRDNETGSELKSRDVAPNGFYIDLASAMYLRVAVKREVLAEGAAALTEDENTLASDGQRFDKEGVYTVTVSDESTGQETVIRIYVGSNSILKAYVTTGLSLAEIDAKLAAGAVIRDDGTIIELTSGAPEPAPAESERSAAEEDEPLARSDNTDEDRTPDDGSGFLYVIILVMAAIIVMLAGGGAVILLVLRKSDDKQ